MTTQTVADPTATIAQAPLHQRIGKAAYRVLELMTESAYQGFQARTASRFDYL
ncbi:hypothetical protein [Halomonas cerina]|uniref:Uncharacterized protein n=1 Tax=Halomonas cerina TaxID=447424 RepID=A0A839V8C0_9GAMM|nr:hypothetical protein [Halomonas cerina]MBB3191903.1 hypothetical protein [Halomonas cerina]